MCHFPLYLYKYVHVHSILIRPVPTILTADGWVYYHHCVQRKLNGNKGIIIDYTPRCLPLLCNSEMKSLTSLAGKFVESVVKSLYCMYSAGSTEVSIIGKCTIRNNSPHPCSQCPATEYQEEPVHGLHYSAKVFSHSK